MSTFSIIFLRILSFILRCSTRFEMEVVWIYFDIGRYEIYIWKTSSWIFLQCHSYLDISSSVHSLHHLSLNLFASEVTGCVKSLGAADLRGKLPTQNQGQCRNTSAHYSLRKFYINSDQKDIAKVKALSVEIWHVFNAKKGFMWVLYAHFAN